MNKPAATDLMHAVLDGEATPEQIRDLDLLLARDPAARAEFDELRALFDDLARVPQPEPPENLQQRILAHANQLLATPGVIGSSTHRTGLTKLISSLRRNIMADNDRSGSDMKKIWMGGAVAAAAVVAIVVLQFGPGGKPTEKDVVGTVMPAQRYRAEQPTSSDVQVVAPSSAGATKSGDSNENKTAQSNSASQGSAAVQGPLCSGGGCRSPASNNNAQANTASQGSAAVQGPLSPPGKTGAN